MLLIVCGINCILYVVLFINYFDLRKMKRKKVLIEFGERVREIRKHLNLSQEELSFKAELHRTYIGMIERAERNLTLINIEKIAKALNVGVKELF